MDGMRRGVRVRKTRLGAGSAGGRVFFLSRVSSPSLTVRRSAPHCRRTPSAGNSPRTGPFVGGDDAAAPRRPPAAGLLGPAAAPAAARSACSTASSSGSCGLALAPYRVFFRGRAAGGGPPPRAGMGGGMDGSCMCEQRCERSESERTLATATSTSLPPLSFFLLFHLSPARASGCPHHWARVRCPG